MDSHKIPWFQSPPTRNDDFLSEETNQDQSSRVNLVLGQNSQPKMDGFVIGTRERDFILEMEHGGHIPGEKNTRVPM